MNLSEKTKILAPLLRLKKEGEFRWEKEHQDTFEKIKEYLSNPPVLTPPILENLLKLYISASEETIGAMLAQEDKDNNERVIY